jgi:hypothetical protein
MATYQQIQDYVDNHYRWKPKSFWIAHVKELCGIEVRRASNRQFEERINPCPPTKRPAIEDALRHFRMI